MTKKLNAGGNIAIYGGSGCAGAPPEIIAVAERLKATVAHTSRAKDFRGEVEVGPTADRFPSLILMAAGLRPDSDDFREPTPVVRHVQDRAMVRSATFRNGWLQPVAPRGMSRRSQPPASWAGQTRFTDS